MTEITTKVIDEIKEITAKLNLPALISKIKAQAFLGLSFCTISVSQMNEYDRMLLQQEGFRVTLIDEPRDFKSEFAQYRPKEKQWKIEW